MSAGPRRLPIPVGAAVAFLVVLLGGCGADHAAPAVDRAELAALAVPAAHERGEALFESHCARCHGAVAMGTEDRGPPLVHPYYRPAHHADAAFHLAVERGVRPHHWRFGPMPPVPEVDRDDAAEIIGYVRWLQREAGIS